MISEHFSIKMLRIQSISETAQVMPNSSIMYQLTNRQKNSISFLFSTVKYCGISTRKKNVIPLLESGVKIIDGGLYFIFSFHFYFTFYFFFFFIFLFLEQLGLGFICHAVTSVTN